MKLDYPILDKLKQIHPSGTWIPWVILLIGLVYFGGTFWVGRQIYLGNESPKIMGIGKVLPIPVAQVGGKLVFVNTYADFKHFIETFVERVDQGQETLNLETPIRDQVMNIVVQNAILERSAKEYGVRVSDTEVDNAFKNVLVSENGAGPPRDVSEEELHAILDELYGPAKGKLKEFIRIRLIENKVKNEVLEQVKFRHILVSKEDKAKELVDKIKSGGNFEELAKEFSEEAQTRDSGGLVEFTSRGKFAEGLEELEKTVFSASIGLVESPVKSNFGYHVVEVLERRGKAQQSFEEWFEAARNKYHVKVYLPPSKQS